MTTTIRVLFTLALLSTLFIAAAQADVPKFNFQVEVEGVYNHLLFEGYKSYFSLEASVLSPINNTEETEFALRFGVKADDGAVKLRGMTGVTFFPNGDTNLLLIGNLTPYLGHDLFLGLLWEVHFPAYLVNERGFSVKHIVDVDLLWEATDAVTFGLRVEGRIGGDEKCFPTGLAAEFKTSGGAFEIFAAYQYVHEDGVDPHGFLLRLGYSWESQD